ncbi:phage tail terminator protein [Niveispirillum sp. KHB5.9]|uniref:phage tail terminator protein n=1 Tax=Niveispirillum sp. KHB5.9 TaxID=3400269 RepID=UPI003A89F41A
MIIHEFLKAADAAGAGTEGVDLFLGAVPAEIGRSALFTPNGGDFHKDTNGGLRNSKFLVTVKDAAFQDAYDFALSLMGALTIRQQQLAGHWVYHCLPSTEPVPLTSEGSGVFAFNINFDATWRLAV